MKKFFDDNLLLDGETATHIYQQIKNLPIVDYHCHLDEKAIAANVKFENIGQLWLSGDHYKWRAMRLCGVEEKYITGDANYHDKFLAYANIMPQLLGNPLYYWSHMELAQIFDIHQPLCQQSAESIWTEANAKLAEMTVGELLKKFKVEYVATTDDPMSELTFHGKSGDTEVRPTFRPDGCFAAGMDKKLLEERLRYFVSKGCKIADHGFDDFGDTTNVEWLCEMCYKYNIVLQLHFGTFRNVNETAFEQIGRDSGFDIMRSSVSVNKLAQLLSKLNAKLGGLPDIVLYPLNDNYVKSCATLSGAFRNVRVGAAWWFNDTVCGIKRQLETVSEYSVLGTQLGMLTDSRSFSSYVRFDFFRRILASFIAAKVDNGEYDENAAIKLASDIAYYNIKNLLATKGAGQQ